jgi:hypothetical protein
MDSDVILMSDERVRGVTVAECGEPLVDPQTVRGLRLDDRRADADGRMHACAPVWPSDWPRPKPRST